MSEDSPATKTAQLILSPIGGFVIGILVLPTGCAETFDILAGESCPPDKQTNFLGLTMGGFVGTVDDAGAFVIGVIAAMLTYAVIDIASSRPKPPSATLGWDRQATLGVEFDDLATLTKDELYKRARAVGIQGRSTMSKEQLLAALRAHRS